ncbi:MAG: hypothetical protein HYR51_05250 [Candidatus Rokubacteria bacterium]|nr:hypothetical protein [Candidatus Rokubacteria bacterium]
MTSSTIGRRAPTALPAVLISLAVSGLFVVAARWIGDAPPLAIWGGVVWVFLLSTIVTLPLVVGRRRERGQ